MNTETIFAFLLEAQLSVSNKLCKLPIATTDTFRLAMHNGVFCQLISEGDAFELSYSENSQFPIMLDDEM